MKKLIMGLFSLTMIFGFALRENYIVEEYTPHVMKPGETIWNVVKIYNPDPPTDVRNIIQLTLAHNEIHGIIHPGASIEVPVVKER